MKSTSRLIPSADSAVISIGKSHRLPGSSNVTRALAGYRDNFAIRSAIVIAPPISGRSMPALNLLEKSGLISTHRGQTWPRSHRPSPELRSSCGYREQQKRRRSQSQSGGQCEAPPPCDRPRGGRSSVAIPDVKTTLRTRSDKSTDTHQTVLWMFCSSGEIHLSRICCRACLEPALPRFRPLPSWL